MNDTTKENKSILVTGGAGYIGSFTVKSLVESGYTVDVIDDLSTGNRKSLPNDVTFYHGSIGDTDLLEKVFTDTSFSAVVHLAAKISVSESVANPASYYETNLNYTILLLEFMAKHRVEYLAFSSTAAVYGEPEYLPIDEEHPLNPINPYGQSKLEAEKAINSSKRIKSIIFRYFNTAGAAIDGSLGEIRKQGINLIPIALANLRDGRATTIFGNDWDTDDGTCVRDYIHVEDIVSAHIIGLKHLLDGGKGGIFNLGSEKGSSVKEVINAISKNHGKEIKTIIGDRRKGDPARLVASSGRAREILGWSPLYTSLDTIASSAYKWHMEKVDNQE